jgi:glycine hydroxymethyltransferase
MNPGGVRIGTPAITTRGMNEKDMDFVAQYLTRVSEICIESQIKGGKNLKQFLQVVENDPNVAKLAKEVQEFSTQFYIPGVEEMFFDKEYKIDKKI